MNYTDCILLRYLFKSKSVSLKFYRNFIKPKILLKVGNIFKKIMLTNFTILAINKVDNHSNNNEKTKCKTSSHILIPLTLKVNVHGDAK